MKVTDPVCGMTIESEKAAARADFAGRTYYFCSEHCHKQFQSKPQQYVRTEKKPGGQGPGQ